MLYVDVLRGCYRTTTVLQFRMLPRFSRACGTETFDIFRSAPPELTGVMWGTGGLGDWGTRGPWWLGVGGQGIAFPNLEHKDLGTKVVGTVQYTCIIDSCQQRGPCDYHVVEMRYYSMSTTYGVDW
jgi:hypothetical protein